MDTWIKSGVLRMKRYKWSINSWSVQRQCLLKRCKYILFRRFLLSVKIMWLTFSHILQNCCGLWIWIVS
jgi:hypothetical protein